jgi:hypothetical protein
LGDSTDEALRSNRSVDAAKVAQGGQDKKKPTATPAALIDEVGGGSASDHRSVDCGNGLRKVVGQWACSSLFASADRCIAGDKYQIIISANSLFQGYTTQERRELTPSQSGA